ncbi:MAG: glycosyltransferase [Actinomycetota bacterium]
MRLLYIIDSLVPGGAEQSLAALASRYRDRGIELEVAYLHDRPGLQEALTDAGAQLFCLAGPGGRLGWAGRAAQLVRHRRPDLVHTTLFEADVAGRIAASVVGVPVVSSLVNVEYGPEQINDPRLKSWRLRGAQVVDALTARRVARFHSITRHVADVMAARLRIPRNRITVVPRGRDPQQLGIRTQARREAARRSLGIEPGTPLIVAAARHEYQKGLDVLLHALPEVLRVAPGVRLAIAGREGHQTDELKRQVRNLDLDGSVTFLGIRSDVPDLICGADAFVVPSRWEGLGSVLLEAMALEAPIVASDLPPVREVVSQAHARLVPTESPDLMARALGATLFDPVESDRRARLARARFMSDYAIERIADQMVSLYSEALDKSAINVSVLSQPDDTSGAPRR